MKILNFKNRNSGFTLLETLIGTALFLIVFIGIFGLIQFGLKVSAQSKARITASALANQKIELARNLPYNVVGTTGGIPQGSIQENEIAVRNNINYAIKTSVIYMDDPIDNQSPNDPWPNDYKRIKVKVSWTVFWGGEVVLQTDIAPKATESGAGQGVISVLVFDANGEPVPQTDIHVENSVLIPPIDANYQTDDQGRLNLPGALICDTCYKITASKFGYSTDRTYLPGELIRGVALAEPNKSHVSVIEGRLSDVSFSIDRVGTKTINTIRYVDEKTWDDSFTDLSKISENYQVFVNTTSGNVEIEQQEGQYLSSGYVLSVAITPTALADWNRIVWNQNLLINTDIRYHVLYKPSTEWVLIPDDDLTINGHTNSEGFSDSPLDLSSLDTLKYASIKIKAVLSTTDVNQTPTLFNWEVTWFSSDSSLPVPNIPFIMTGAKILGNDAIGNPIYKYESSPSTNANGILTIQDIEWDGYEIELSTGTGYDLANSYLAQPVNIDPGVNATTTLKLAFHQPNALLVTVKNSAGQALVGASTRLYKTGYNKTKLASDSGQAFFSPLSLSAYALEAKIAGYQDYSEQVNVSGQTTKIIIMLPPE